MKIKTLLKYLSMCELKRLHNTIQFSMKIRNIFKLFVLRFNAFIKIAENFRFMLYEI